MKKKSPFRAVVFAGGGSRCLWQAGFFDVAASALGIEVEEAAAASAGAAMACMFFAGTTERGVEYFKKITGENRKNFYPENIVSKTPCFPQAAMYRDVIAHALDKKALAKLKKDAPHIKILVSRPPRFLGAQSATFAGMCAYAIEKHLFKPVHPVFAAKIGFTGADYLAENCCSPEELSDLIIASSCTPPFVPVVRWDKRIALDGGLIDNVPVSLIDESKGGKTLILLTRRYPLENIPKNENRLYVQPSKKIPVSKMDYSHPDKIQEAFDLGRFDGERFVKEFRKK